jgi:hypothetical protein
LLFKGTYAWDFIVHFLHFLASFNNRQDRGPKFSKLPKLNVKFSFIIGLSRIPCNRRKCIVSRSVFRKNTMFHYAYSSKMFNSASPLNSLYTTKSAQIYSTYSLTTINWFLLFRRKCEEWRHFFTKILKMLQKHTVMKTMLISLCILATTLSFATRFWWKQGVIENVEKFEDFLKC